MNASFYLVIKATQRSASYLSFGGARVTRKKPATGSNEIALSMSVDIPDSLFQKPTLEATISVPKDGQRDAVITAEVAENIAAIIKERTGIVIEIKAPEAD